MSLDGFFDGGDIDPGSSTEDLRQSVSAFLAAFPAETVPIAIGGDHSITLPIVAALCEDRLPLKVVSFDHHLDLQFWSTGRDALYNTNVMSHVSDRVGPGQVVHIGVEPVQTVETRLLDQYRSYLQQVGVQIPVLSNSIDDDEFVLDAVGTSQDLYITVDVDVLSRNEMQSTAYPSDVGLSLARVRRLIHLLATRNRVVGCDIVEFGATAQDRRAITLSDASRASSLLLELMIAVASRSNADTPSSKILPTLPKL